MTQYVGKLYYTIKVDLNKSVPPHNTCPKFALGNVKF